MWAGGRSVLVLPAGGVVVVVMVVVVPQAGITTIMASVARTAAARRVNRLMHAPFPVRAPTAAVSRPARTWRMFSGFGFRRPDRRVLPRIDADIRCRGASR